MRQEIGSEFWEIPKTENVTAFFASNVSWYLSGTSALHSILRDIEKTHVVASAALPSWCCECMIQPFLEHGIKVQFYPVVPKESGGVFCDFSEVSACDILFLMDYFGYRSDNRLQSFSGIVIRDLTHSIFCGAYHDADYYYGSLRKWAGFYTGGFAWKEDSVMLEPLSVHPQTEQYIQLRKQAMEAKRQYIEGVSDSKAYLETYEAAENLLDMGCIGMAAQRDIEAAKHLAVDSLKKRRRANAEQLLEAVSEFALFPKLGPQDCPLFVPVCLPTEWRDSLRRELIRQEIYCPIHWPESEMHRLTAQMQRLYATELSLICDQRYTATDMDRLCTAVQTFLKSC